MDNGTFTPSDVAQINQLIAETSRLRKNYVCLAALTALVYSTALSFASETRFMWKKKLSIPSILYFLARYGTVLYFCTTTLSAFSSQTGSLRICSIVNNLSNSLSVLAYTGIQGLLVARAYSLSQSLDYRVKYTVLTLLGFLYLSGVIIPIYISAAYSGCVVSFRIAAQRLNVAVACLTIATDSVAFAVTVYQVWGTWVTHRELGQHSSNGTVSLLLKQGMWRYSFVLSITLINTILLVPGTVPAVTAITFTFLQESMSAILLCEFSLQLRRNNQPSTEESRIHQLEVQTSPPLSFQNARATLRSLHDNITAEFGQLEVDIFDFKDADDVVVNVETDCVGNQAAVLQLEASVH